MAAFADEASPAFMIGAFELLASMWLDEPKLADAGVTANTEFQVATAKTFPGSCDLVLEARVAQAGFRRHYAAFRTPITDF